MLDERLRARLRELGERDAPGLSSVARARVLEHVAARGPAAVRAARRARLASLGALGALAAAAATALVVGAGGESEVRGDAPAVATAPEVPERPPAPRRPCEDRDDPSAVAVGFTARGARSVLDLGAVARAEAPETADLYLEEATRCRTVVQLRSGRVVVHAKDLGGGLLLVRSGAATVEVRGTVFGVARSGSTLAVDVAEGRVVVTREDRRPLEVEGGSRLRLEERDDSYETVPLDGAEESALLSEAAGDRIDAAAPAARAESAEALLRRADELRNAGDLAGARKLYRRAGRGTGASAEAAWIALARLELAEGNAGAARDATEQRSKRFAGGVLGAESLWVDVRTHRQAGNLAAARRAAEDLVARFPASPQAAAARRFLAESPPP